MLALSKVLPLQALLTAHLQTVRERPVFSLSWNVDFPKYLDTEPALASIFLFSSDRSDSPVHLSDLLLCLSSLVFG